MEGKMNQKKTLYLKAEAILKFFLDADDEIDTLIKCKSTEVNLLTYDFDLYQALGSLKPQDAYQQAKLIKLLEAVDVLSYRKNFNTEKPVLTDERVDELRKTALIKVQK